MISHHHDPIEGGANPCFNCPPIPTQAPMEKLIAVGFGCAIVTRDGEMVLDGEHPPSEEYVTFAEAEGMAAIDPDHDWRVVLHGPLHGETYQRQGTEQWVCIERNEGFA